MRIPTRRSIPIAVVGVRNAGTTTLVTATAGPPPMLAEANAPRAAWLVVHDYTRLEAREELADLLVEVRVGRASERVVLVLNKCDARTALDAPLEEVRRRVEADGARACGGPLVCIPVSGLLLEHARKVARLAVPSGTPLRSGRRPLPRTAPPLVTDRRAAMEELCHATDALLGTGGIRKLSAPGDQGLPLSLRVERALERGEVSPELAEELAKVAWRVGGGHALQKACCPGQVR